MTDSGSEPLVQQAGGEIDGVVADLARQVADLTRKVAALTTEMMEHRQLNRRVADLTDVVSQLLLPPGEDDESQFRARLATYLDSLEGAPTAQASSAGEG